MNQGSLSTRMIEEFGDSPQGMVQSALEMIQLFEEQGFTQIVVSLKSSNPIVVQKAYRLLDQLQPERGGVVIHLGVTEAGNGLIGRYKSVAGMGALLLDGIGDTIRVSLTEPAVNEIIFAEHFLQTLNLNSQKIDPQEKFWSRSTNNHRVINKSLSIEGKEIGNASSIKIGVPTSATYTDSESLLSEDFTYRTNNDGEIFFSNQKKPIKEITSADDYQSPKDANHYSAILFNLSNPLHLLRQYYDLQQNENHQLPLGISFPNQKDPLTPLQVTHITAILIEGLVDFSLLPETMNSVQIEEFINLLQASRSRLLIADYIACPSCGRTLFDLEGITKTIQEKTHHLRGVKIGIMGCIVNGPGEMADADFGYVGSAPGKVDLYYKQNCEVRGIDQEVAVEVLIDLPQNPWRVDRIPTLNIWCFQ